MSPHDYARNGWPVFPVSWDGRKNPLIKAWGTAASTDPAQIAAWWRRWPCAQIGVPTGRRSGLVVLDIDTKRPDAHGFDTLDDLSLGILPDTPLVHTRSGGLHVYFSCIGLEIRNSAGKNGLGPGLDVRGEGGFVVVPSPGSGYSWDPHCNPKTLALEPAPVWLGHREKQTRHPADNVSRLAPQNILDTACENIRRAGKGERHDVLNREAFSVGTLVGAGALDEHTARHQLAAATTAMVCRSGGDLRKAERDLDDAFADGLHAPRRAAR
jgi:Bifunctional DNA primase/polymerase, N-terminal